MTMQYRYVIFAVLMLALGSSPAGAEVPETGLVWVGQRLRYPVGLGEVYPAAPFVPEQTPEVDEEVQVEPGRNAAFYLDGLQVVRVVAVNGDPGALTFSRVFGGSRTSERSGLVARVEEHPGMAAGGGFLLSQPAGAGDVWCVGASAPVKIRIQYPKVLPGGLAWERARAALLDAIETDGPLPELPMEGDYQEASATLEAQATLGRLLVAEGGSPVVAAVRAWRKAAALREVDGIRPLVDPYWTLEDLSGDLPGESVTLKRADSDDEFRWTWRRLNPSNGQVRIKASGPGLLRVQARNLLPAGTLRAKQPSTVSVLRENGSTVSLTVTGRRARTSSDPQAAFPSRTELVTKTGEWAGKLAEGRIVLQPGVHEYLLRVDAPVLVRVSAARRRPLLVEGLQKRVTTEDFVRLGLDSVQGTRGPAVDLILALLREVNGENPGPAIAGLSPALGLVSEVVSASHEAPSKAEGGRRAERWTRQISTIQDIDLRWWVSIQAAPLLDDPVAARTLFAATGDVPPPGFLAAAAMEFGRPGLYQDRPDRALGALELAWRALPVPTDVRRQYINRWIEGTAWSRLRPTITVDGNPLTPDSMVWLDTAAGTGGPISRASRVFYRLPAGSSRTYLAEQSVTNPEAPSRLTAMLRTPSETGVVGLDIDNRSFRALPLTDLERLDVAVPPGRHTVSLNAPLGSDAWLSLPPAEVEGVQPEDVAITRTYWPLSVGGEPVRYELPAPSIPLPVRVDLRVLDPQLHEDPVTFRMVTNTGAEWAMEDLPGLADPSLLPVNSEGAISSVATATVTLPPGTDTLWFEAPEGSPVIASVSVRRTVPVDDGGFDGGWTPGSLTELAELGQRILADPTDAGLLLRRAEVLAYLGDLGMARQDLRRIVRLGDRRGGDVDQVALERLRDGLRAASDARYLAPFGELAELSGPVPVSAGLVAATAGDPPPAVMEVVHTARTQGAAEALRALQAMDLHGPSVEWLRASLLSATGRDVDGAMSLIDAWRRSGAWQYGLEAAGLLGASEVGSGQEASPGTSSAGYGLAADLRTRISHPEVSHLALLAGRRSQWEPVSGVERSAGRARVISADTFVPSLPRAAVRSAMTTPPWATEDAQFVTAKSPASISTHPQGTVLADVWCQALRLGAVDGDPGCVAELSVDGVMVKRATLSAFSSTTIESPRLSADAHRIMVTINDPGRTNALSVRFRSPVKTVDAHRVSDGWVLQVQHESAGFLGTPESPVSLVVLGPSSLYTDVRMLGGDGGMVDISAVGPSGSLPVRSLVVPASVDSTVRLNAGSGSRVSTGGSAYLVLPEAGAWTITWTPRSGVALVRGAFRQEMGAPKLDRPGSPWRDVPSDTEPLTWPAVAPAMSGLDGVGTLPRRWKEGTFSVGAMHGKPAAESLAAGSVVSVQQLETTAAWRWRPLPNTLWLKIEGLQRTAPSVAKTLGGRAEVLLRWRAPDLRFHLKGQLLRQDVLGSFEHGSDLSLRIYRPIQLFRSGYLIPSVVAERNAVSLAAMPVGSGPAAGTAGDFIDSDVFSQYTLDHPRALRPSVLLRWMAWQDLLGMASLRATTNADLVSLDQAGLTFIGRGVVRAMPALPVQVEAKLRPTLHLSDANRTLAYWRTGLGGTIGSRVPLGHPAALWFGIGDTVYLSSYAHSKTLKPTPAPIPTENVVTLWMRVDFSGGRGVSDLFPLGDDFNEVLGGELWRESPGLRR